MEPLIFDVARGSRVDGPGMRTVVFLKGCPFTCVWCHNPESQHPLPQMIYDRRRCTHCGRCRQVCPDGAIDLKQPYIVRADQCSFCGRCEQHCDNLALRISGKPYSDAQLTELVLRDRSFYTATHGGVTFSGGEPLLYIDFMAGKAAKLKRAGLHIAVETCGYFDYEKFRRKVMPWIDLVLFDIKVIDSEQHKHFTGISNDVVLKNFKRLCVETDVAVRPRVPLVPHIITTRRNLRQIAALFSEYGIHQFDLLPYNSSIKEKWQLLGLACPAMVSHEPMPLAREIQIRKEFEYYLINPGGCFDSYPVEFSA